MMLSRIRQTPERLRTWYGRYERPISSLSLISGFIFEAVTLERVDLFLENFWIIVHLAIAGAAILLLNLNDQELHSELAKSEPNKEKILKKERIHFWLLLITQFGFGGLLSTFIVFYFRSASLIQSWPFML